MIERLSLDMPKNLVDRTISIQNKKELGDSPNNAKINSDLNEAPLVSRNSSQFVIGEKAADAPRK